MTSEFNHNSVLMKREIQVNGNAYPPSGTPDEQSRFYNLCKKASRRWRLPIQTLQVYSELFNSAPPVDTRHVGWFESETQAIVQRWKDKEEFTLRDVDVFHNAKIRLGWDSFRTLEEYTTKVNQLNDFYATFASTAVAPQVDSGDESEVPDSESDDVVVAETVPVLPPPRKRTWKDTVEILHGYTVAIERERERERAIKKRKQELAKPQCPNCKCPNCNAA